MSKRYGLRLDRGTAEESILKDSLSRLRKKKESKRIQRNIADSKKSSS